MGKVSNSIGKSLSTLTEVMEKNDVNAVITNEHEVSLNQYEYEVSLNKAVSGIDADMLYVEFDIDGDIYSNETSEIKRFIKSYNDNLGIYVVVHWGDGYKNSMLSILGNGKLLIPLGTNVNWLLNEHSNFSIELRNANIPLKIKNMEFYKLQQIE